MKSYIIYGGSSGIGKAVALMLLKFGERVAIVSNNRQELQSALDQLDSAQQERTLPLVADVRESDNVRQTVANAVDRFGGLDGMVFSAGIQVYGTVVSTPEATWDECIETNLKGAFLAGKYCIPQIAVGGGSVVIVSSVQALACQNDVAAYAASKGGLNAMTRAMALDHASQCVRVNVVCPGSVDTPMLRRSAAMEAGENNAGSVLAEWGGYHPLGRVAHVDEIASVIVFLLSDKATFITGAEITVDGGLTAALAVKLAR